MSYYCFLCNENHNGLYTEEHFIPRAIDGPEHQWLPVCKTCNTRSNTIFDNKARDILYLVRFTSTGDLKREGEALLGNGTLRKFKFSYHEDTILNKDTAFQYVFDRETNEHIPKDNVYGIAYMNVRFENKEWNNIVFCRFLFCIKFLLVIIAYKWF